MLSSTRILNSLGLEVELLMILEIDNKGAVDICNSWTVGGRTIHVEIKMTFLRELKEQGLVKVVWKKGTEMSADLYDGTQDVAQSDIRRFVFSTKGVHRVESLGHRCVLGN
mmetsp:Transcript_22545/g.50372  ORF Transcript_22545/g.50372 Transcript_22545/m.50372 type:complete len:111 (-) Transcript_22545:80-412(-)